MVLSISYLSSCERIFGRAICLPETDASWSIITPKCPRIRKHGRTTNFPSPHLVLPTRSSPAIFRFWQCRGSNQESCDQMEKVAKLFVPPNPLSRHVRFLDPGSFSSQAHCKRDSTWSEDHDETVHYFDYHWMGLRVLDCLFTYFTTRVWLFQCQSSSLVGCPCQERYIPKSACIMDSILL